VVGALLLGSQATPKNLPSVSLKISVVREEQVCHLYSSIKWCFECIHCIATNAHFDVIVVFSRSWMATLGKFFQRAAQKVQESVGGQPKTVDGDFESRKAEYKRFTNEYGILFRRLEYYFKQIKEDARNYEKVAETSRAIYNGTTEVSETFDALSRKTIEALAAYEAAWVQTKDMMAKYDAIIKHMV
jgi:hypothetical protein